MAGQLACVSALCRWLRLDDSSGRVIGLSHYDRCVALGRIVSAEPNPRSLCFLGISLRHQNDVCWAYLRDGWRATTLCYWLSPDPRPAHRAGGRRPGHGVTLAAKPRKRRAPAKGNCAGITNGNRAVDEPGGIAWPRFYRNAAFPFRASSTCDVGRRWF